MFRWLALCLVLCVGAFALVALATGAFIPTPPPPPDNTPMYGPASAVDEPIVMGGTSGLGRGSVVLPQARLTAVEREEAPSQRDGTVLIVGTDELGDSPRPSDLVPVRFPVLLLEIGDKAAGITPPADVPESQWLYLVQPRGSNSPEAFSQARMTKKEWDDYKNSNLKVYRRWQEGDSLDPTKIEVTVEQKFFRTLKEGDWVNKGQLIALVDPTVQIDDVSSKVAKMSEAEADYRAAIKTKEEAIRRASSAELLWSKGKGYISEDDYRAALLNKDRYIEEESAKDAARTVARKELNASLTILKLHQVRASISGEIKAAYKHPGESVKNLDAILQIQNPLKLRVEGVAGMQDAQSLAFGMPVVVEPVRPTPNIGVLSGHQGEVTCVAVSRPTPDGKKLIVSGSEDGTVRFWDRTAPRPEVARLEVHTGVLALACTGLKAARNLALVGDRDGVGRIIDLDRLLPPPAAAEAGVGAAAALTQAPPVKLAERHKGPITCVAFSPDGTVCATGGEDRTIRLWDADGKLIQTLTAAHKAAVTSLQFAQPEGQPLQLVSAGGDDALCVWDLKNLQAPARSAVLPYRSGDVAKLGVSADGKYVLFDHGSELRVLSLESRQTVGVIQSSSASANFTTMALFAPDGNTILTNSGSDGRLQLWRAPGRLAGDDPNRASQLRQFVWLSGAATCAAFDPDEKETSFAVTGSHDNAVLVWAMPKADEVLRKPRETRLSLVERSIDSGARQVRIWADLPEIPREEWLRGTDLRPGGLATMIVPPAADAK